MDTTAAMWEAIALAQPFHPHPNPRVGAVVLDGDGAVVGRGAHVAAGSPHAEVLALHEAGGRSRGGTLVVSLEPCDHQGRTPPCTEAILEAGIRRVVIGATDPDRRVSGKGIESLHAAGVEVVMSPDSESAEQLDPGYFHHRRTGRPLVTLKLAMTLDGQTAAADGTSQWITSEASRRDAHQLRSRSDAVMVGAGTLMADDPALTVRMEGFDAAQPRPVLILGRREVSPSLQVFGRDPLVFSPHPADLPGEVLVRGEGDRVDLAETLAALGERGIVDLLVEGGAVLAGELHRLNLVDRYVLYLGASLAGGVGVPALVGPFAALGDSRSVNIVGVERIGPDVRIEAERTDGAVG